MLRQSLIVMLAVASWCPAAQATATQFEAILAPPPKATLEPSPDLGPNPLDCPIALCGLHLPEAIWQRDTLKKQRAISINSDAVATGRSRRAALERRFTETPLLETKLGDSSCFGSLMMTKGFEDKTIIKFLRCGF